MSLEKLTGKILEEARSEADRILSETEKDVERLEQELNEEKTKISGTINRKAEQLASEKHRNILTGARIDARNRELAEMQKVVAEVFEKGYDKISKLPADKYSLLMKKMILTTGLTKIAISMGKKDGKVFDKNFLSDLEKDGIKASLSSKDANFDHGFLLQSGELTMDFSLEQILSIMKEDLVVNIKKKLFED